MLLLHGLEPEPALQCLTVVTHDDPQFHHGVPNQVIVLHSVLSLDHFLQVLDRWLHLQQVLVADSSQQLQRAVLVQCWSYWLVDLGDQLLIHDQPVEPSFNQVDHVHQLLDRHVLQVIRVVHQLNGWQQKVLPIIQEGFGCIQGVNLQLRQLISAVLLQSLDPLHAVIDLVPYFGRDQELVVVVVVLDVLSGVFHEQETGEDEVMNFGIEVVCFRQLDGVKDGLVPIQQQTATRVPGRTEELAEKIAIMHSDDTHALDHMSSVMQAVCNSIHSFCALKLSLSPSFPFIRCL